ncbi:MAG: DNA internalization-related competence protein ComEC/Rec2 [Candidatus Promineifilaceae bacterium]|nr:DNA internalization-related competence protein ComEC/Rec2 [Candidatus Promineifilaceae bacterium]
MTAVLLAACWLCGLFLAAGLGVSPTWWVGGGLIFVLGALLLRSRGRVALALLAVAFVAAGGARYMLSQPTIDEQRPSFYHGKQVMLTGIVVAPPERREFTRNLLVEVEAIAAGGRAPQAGKGRVLVRVHPLAEAGYGSRVEVSGRLQEAEGPMAYLARRGVESWMNYPTLTIVGAREGNPLYQILFTFRAEARETINRLLPEPQAGLLRGILLGEASSLPPDLAEAFRVTGMTHIIAISGFNIMLLVGVLFQGSRLFTGIRPAALLAMGGVALYTIFVGAGPSVVRAALMGAVFLATRRLLGRPSYPYASLFLAALVMTLVQPRILWDAGFQLSFAATLGLMRFVGPLERQTRSFLERRVGREWAVGGTRLLSEAVLVTLAAQLLTLPLILFHFGRLSLASLPANLLILPAQPAVMVVGGLATLVGMVLPALGQVLGWIAWLFLAYTTEMVELLARLPLASIEVELGAAGLVVLYGTIWAVTWLAQMETERRRALLIPVQSKAPAGLLMLSAALVLLAWQWQVTQPDGLLHVVFLDVGQGDAIFIQTPSGQQILVDGGPAPGRLQQHLGDRLPFWDSDLDAVIATHPDGDHVAGLLALFERYRIAQLLTNGQQAEAGAYYSELLRVAEHTGVAIRPVHAGETVIVGDVRLEILHPGPTLSENDNDNSLALRLVYGAFTLLLTGDGELEAERAMVQSGRPLHARVFKAGHHGGRTASNDFFLEAVQPAVVVVSAGRDNRFGHPHPEVALRTAEVGAALLRTDQLGTIEVISDGRQMWWTAER